MSSFFRSLAARSSHNPLGKLATYQSRARVSSQEILPSIYRTADSDSPRPCCVLVMLLNDPLRFGYREVFLYDMKDCRYLHHCTMQVYTTLDITNVPTKGIISGQTLRF